MKITSSNVYFENLMDWAQNKTAQFIMTGKTGDINRGEGNKFFGPSGKILNSAKKTKKRNKPWTKEQKYIPSYWAGYYDRTAYYIRDFVHQAPGAEMLGYSEENYQMLKSFASLASEETGWYAPWALNFDGSIYYMDTPNYRSFVRELPAQYELVETFCKLYFMTGDKRYTEPVFINFAERTLNEFTNNQDGIVFSDKNGIPEGVGNLWKGCASYNEGGKAWTEAGDCIGAMYKALKYYGMFCNKIGDTEKFSEYTKRAEELKRYFNDEWSVSDSGAYVFGVDKKGKKYTEWTKSARGIIGGETMFIMPVKELPEAGGRTDKLLDYIDERVRNAKTCMPNIESYTYLPQVFFPYHRAENAWYWMKHIGDRVEEPHVKASQGKNGDYPEISFTLISAAVEGLLGFSADLPNGKVETYPCLPNEIPDIKVSDISVGYCNFDVSVTNNSAELTNKSDKSITWKCAFAGVFEKLIVNGEEINCSRETVNGVEKSFAEIEVKAGETVKIK